MGYCRARLTPFGRRLLVDRIVELGWPVAQAAESVGVSRQTAYRWMRRWREEGEAGLEDRSSRPHHSPNRVSSEMEKRIVSDRITEKEGPHLTRRGLSRLSRLGFGPHHRHTDPLRERLPRRTGTRGHQETGQNT